MKKYLLTLIVLLGALAVEAQTLLRRAEIAYEGQNYRSAVVSYEKYLAKKGQMTSDITRPLANSYYYLGNYPKAQIYYDKTREREMSSREWLNYAEMLRKQGAYDEAILKYQKAKKAREKNVPVSRINLGIKACEWAIENKGKSGDGKAVLNPSGMDTKGQSLGVRFYEDGVVYSSTNRDVYNKKNQDANGNPILNLAFYYEATDSTPSRTVGFSHYITCKSHIGSAEFSADGKTIYYTKLVSNKNDVKARIFTAQLNEEVGDWVREEVLSFCNGTFNYAHPALSLDGKTLYFASDMEGTLGGMDIFKAKKTSNGWGEPVNLGKVINTEATEIFPYVTPGGYLSFASNGHPGYGGMDAYWVEMKNGKPVKINNAYRPINSSWDDFAAVIDPNDTLKGYVSSNRDTEGLYDSIYAMELSEEYLAELRGVNMDSINQALIAQAKADSVAREDSLTMVQAMLAQEEDNVGETPESTVEVVQDEAFVLLNPNLLFGVQETGIVETFLVDALSSQLLPNATFELSDNISKEVLLSGVSDDSANVKMDLKSAGVLVDQALTITVKADYGDFSSYVLQLVSDRLKTYDQEHPVMLTPIMARRDKVKDNIVADEEVTGGAPFQFDGFELTPEGRAYLDAWADFLVKNPKVKIKLMTHTDSRGDVSYNFRLSQRRAFEAKRYLISQGVNHMQIIARGYGERYPLVNCTECTEKEHSANRRIEMEVINSNKK